MNTTNQNVEFLQTGETQTKNPIKPTGILIYPEAKHKLQISNSGKIYKQKVLSYIPFIGPLFSLVYANVCIGKTRCLKTADSKKFKSASKSINWFGFIFWPIIFLGIWTLLQYLLMDFGQPNLTGSFVKMWNDTITGLTNGAKFVELAINEKLPADQITTIIFAYIGTIFNLLVTIFVQPFNVGEFTLVKFSDTIFIPSNILFIASFLVLTFINPINIVNSIILNSKKRRFIVVQEDTSVYQYRS